MRNILRATIPIACALVAMPAIAQVPVLDSTPIAGCPAETLAFHACAQDKAKNFSPSRTTDGRPDLQGFWRGRLTMDRSVEGIDGTEPMTHSPFNPWSVFPSLIVDTPDRKIPYQPSGNFHTDAAHVVERLTMIDADTIHYEITLEDAKAYTRPWTMAWPLVRDRQPGFELLEEACWEGERALPVFRESGYKYYFGDTWRSR
jgi:hypothetical protein